MMTFKEVHEWARRAPDSQEPTVSLDDFLAAYQEDDNLWWMIGCGHHQNLFDMACDRIEELEDNTY